MAKYPGSFIINEVGSAGDLATIYGVSERTIYRWLNKAAKESGIRPHKKHKTPRQATLAKFKGTRKQLAKKYGVSESTVYRWIKNAKAGGTDIPSRQSSKYPGDETIINLLTNTPMTTKEMAEKFGVSTRTIGRWIRRAKLNQGSLIPDKRKTGEYKLRRKKVNGVWVSYYEKVEETEPEEPFTEPEIEEPWEVPPPDEEIEEPWEVPEPDLYEINAQEYTGDNEEIGHNLAQDLGVITGMLYDNDLLVQNSIFNDLTWNEKIEALNKYIEKCIDDDPELFYNKENGEYMDTSPEFVATINIWGEQFEQWLVEQRESDIYEI